MFDNDERLIKRPKIALVRDFLNANQCISWNPFMCQLNDADLLDVIEEFESNVRLAADKLKEITGVHNLNFTNCKSRADFIAKNVELAMKEGKGLEMSLCEVFQAGRDRSYAALRTLEDMEDQNGSHCFGKAQKAMDELAELYAFAKAVPLVYEHASQKAAPALAVV